MKRIAAISLSAALLLVVSAFGFYWYSGSCSYAISSGDKAICYVGSKADAAKAVSTAIEQMTEKDSDLLLFSSDSGLKVTRVDAWKDSPGDVKTADEAAACIVKKTKDESSDLNINVVSVKTEREDFTPDPVYEKDETKLAGYTSVEEEGENGTVDITYVYTTTDGDVADKSDIEKNVVSEGKSAKITKGTLGVPEGESWETYEGSPVLNNGEDLVVSAKQYVGVLPYVLGGTSLVTGADCVGFVQAIYKLYGVKLSPNLKAQGRAVSYGEAKPGDIICYDHHYGIYAGNGKMVHAANPKMDVCVGSVSKGRIVTIRRILN